MSTIVSGDSHDASRAVRFLRLWTSAGQQPSEKHEELLGMAWNTAGHHHRPKKAWYSLLYSGTWQLLITKLNILLLFMPVALLFYFFGEDWAKESQGIVFLSSMMVLCPLAERLGFITEELALYTNDTLGGLLNATFGNATELIICAFSLKVAKDNNDDGYLRIVQLTLLGSVLGNLLLVLGTAFLIGGLAHPMQSFNQQGMSVNSGLLTMAVGSILLPSTLAATHTQSCEEEDGHSCNSSELALSRFESLFMLGAYTLYLVFQLFTHRHLYEQEDQPDDAESSVPAAPEDGESKVTDPAHLEPVWEDPSPFRNGPQQEGAAVSPVRRQLSNPVDEVAVGLGFTTIHTLERRKTLEAEAHGTPTKSAEGSSPVAAENGEHQQHVEEPVLGLAGALIWLTIVTLLISLFSQFAVETIEDASRGLKIPMPFLSTIVLPIVGNAAEHASAIMFAYKNRMEITLGVAVGSSTQIAVFVIPFTVLLAWTMGQDLDLNFAMFEAFTLFIAVLLTVIAMTDGTSNWLKGMMLIVTYIFISAAFWVHNDTLLDNRGSAA
ncbi:hypothetical protein BSKO_01974 [Bryopsis sp. KO-2023]|nr:hypothetical protein BSKO_01974 [Bryopsis sp. KO-2023]